MEIRGGCGKFHVSVEVVFYRENGIIIATVPALKISTYGDTLEEAQLCVNEMIEGWIESVTERGLMHDTLVGLGWKLVQGGAEPPVKRQERDPLAEYLASESREIELALA